jgi:hypothetical protein
MKLLFIGLLALPLFAQISGGSGVGVQANGGAVGTQPNVNYIPGLGMLWPCANNTGANRVDCTPAANPAFVATHDQIRGAEDACASGNGTPNYTCAMTNRQLQSLTTNMRFMLVPDVNCNVGSSCTVTIDNQAQITLYKADCSTSAAGNVVANQPQWFFYNGSNACMMSDAGVVSNFYTSVSPVSASANVSTDQNLMAVSIPASKLNIANRTLRISGAGIFTTVAANTSTVTVKVKLCSVLGCGSGTVVTLATFVSGANGGGQTNDPFSFVLMSTTQTAGVSSAYEAHGNLTIDLTGVGVSAAMYPDSNATTAGTIDSTAQMYLQVTGAFSSASASNSISQRQMTVEVLN